MEGAFSDGKMAPFTMVKRFDLFKGEFIDGVAKGKGML